MKFKHALKIVIAIVSIIVLTGCSGGNSSNLQNPVSPSFTGNDIRDAGGSSVNHSLLGLYTCIVDESGIEFVPMRDSMFHLNALRFLEPPPPVRIAISNFEFDGQIVDVDVQFIHPFEGLDQFTGFDVCGIVITSGSFSGFSDPDLVAAVDGDTRLLNPDGLTRWWNPREFPFNENIPMWGYIDGGRGTPDDIANFTATINGYKYHADGLSQFDEINMLDPYSRGTFTAGSGHTRHYTIDMAGGFVFNYAVDASWLPPEGDPPYLVPDSFPASANRDEPWLIDVTEYENSLYYDPSTGSGGGDLSLLVECFDWFDANELTVRAESPGIFDPVIVSIPSGGSDVSSTYQVDIHEPLIYSDDPLEVWISAEAAMDYEGFVPGKPTSAFNPAQYFDVETISVQQPELVLVWRDEGVVRHPQDYNNDIDPAIVTGGDGNMYLAFTYYVGEGPMTNYPRYVPSIDFGHTFGPIDKGYWNSHSVNIWWPDWNGKFTLGPDGQPYHSYGAPCGHTLHVIPWEGPYPDPDGGCHSGIGMGYGDIKNAGDMLYTSEGYPLMFGDQKSQTVYGSIWMRRGDIPNISGTGTWPTFTGTEYELVPGTEGNYKWCSLARSTDKTSDGICRLIYWQNNNPYINMISSTDISGTDWNSPVEVYGGWEEIWVAGRDPGLWVDEYDGFHVLFAGELFTGTFRLMYGYSDDPSDWTGNFQTVADFPEEAGLRDTQVTVFDAFDETWVFLSFESGGEVWCMYKNILDDEFSEKIRVNVTDGAILPDFYPNGDVGLVYAYEADSGNGDSNIFWRLAEFELR